MNKRALILFAGLSALILLPVLFLPISNDLAVYVLAGKTIARGGKIYVDFIDVKTPVFFYIHALSYILFGASEISPRIFDYIWQMATVLSIGHVVSRTSGRNAYGYASGLVYALLYSTLNYSQTFHSESLAGLPIAWLFYLVLQAKDSIPRWLAIGLITGFITALKYPMGIVLPAIIIFDIINRSGSFPALFRKYAFIAAGMIVAILACFAPLADPQIFNGYITVSRYLTRYAGFNPYGMAFLKEALKYIAVFFGDYFSLLLFALVVLAIARSFRNPGAGHVCDDKTTRLVTLSAITVCLMIVSILVEKKFNVYLFSRSFMPLSVMAGLGAVPALGFLKENFRRMDLNLKSLSVIILVSALFFSPIPRWIAMLQVSYYYFADQDRYDSLYQSQSDNALKRKDYKEIASMIKTNMNGRQERIFIMAIGANPVFILGGFENYDKFPMSNLYFSANPISEWVYQLPREMSMANWLIIGKDDNHPVIRGVDMSTWQFIQKDPRLTSVLDTEFYKFWENGSFVIYRKK